MTDRGFVGLTECGVGSNQLVNVSNIKCIYIITCTLHLRNFTVTNLTHTCNMFIIHEYNNACIDCIHHVSYYLFVVINCGELTSPANGDVEVSSALLGGVANYTCINGYHVTEPDTRTCGDDGNWSGEEPSCHSKYWTMCIVRTREEGRGSYREGAGEL